MNYIYMFLGIYIICIPLCNWLMKKYMDFYEDDEEWKNEIFSKEYIGTVASWIPILNIWFIILLIRPVYAIWLVKKRVRKLIDNATRELRIRGLNEQANELEKDKEKIKF